MKHLRILKNVLVRTRTNRILLSYIIFVLMDAFVIMISDPFITTYEEALWYCYAVISTVGFGDVVVTSVISKICSVLLTVYSILVIALITGVVVNFYNQLIQTQQKETISAFVDRLQRLPELSKEELQEISDNAKKFMDKNF